MSCLPRIAIGLVWHDGCLIVGRRPAGVVLAGLDEFPGGKCGVEEDPADAVVREVREETGLDVLVSGLRDRFVHHYPHGDVDLFFFDCQLEDPPRVQPLLTPPFQWWQVERLGEARFPDANQRILESIRSSGAPSDFQDPL